MNLPSDYVRQRKNSATNPEADSFHWRYSYFLLSVGGCGEWHEYEPVIFLYWMVSYQKMREMSCWEVLRTTTQILFPEVLRQQNRLWVYGEKQLAGLKTCKLPSKKSALYCTRDPARIIRTIIYRNNIDTDPPYWVLLVLRRVEGRFCWAGESHFFRLCA